MEDIHGIPSLRSRAGLWAATNESIYKKRDGEVETITVTIPLERGWNLISFPGELVDASPQSILGGSVIQILDEGSAEPAALKLGEGYWVLAIETVELSVSLYPSTK